ncbi:unnamed protein product [Acanthoscelides obtectus]|uniref:Uncharacterized protein n=1 Tax=Acanthoscelides obtectus TaxID=200917 RepID=A0A9P0K7X1_ACAOB|nr:unnamed protein product [Acanthoscelides obtectus]CAK1653436.1 hypothetical protein AOBTE_LOCUS18230 [Acanthoscelides obtectus]
MGLSTTDMREIKSTIINTFNEKFLQEIVSKVVQLVEKQFEEKLNRNEEENNRLFVTGSRIWKGIIDVLS